MQNKLYGLVLAGGESRRMGTDKGSILAGEKTWTAIAFEKLSKYCQKVCVSVNSSQEHIYSPKFGYENIIMDNIHIKGPLCGLLSAHKSFPDVDWVILACDMTDITLDLISKIILEYEFQHLSQNIVFCINNHVEPLLGIYKKEFLAVHLSLILNKKLENVSMKHFLETYPTQHILPEEKEYINFKNYNALQDLFG